MSELKGFSRLMSRILERYPSAQNVYLRFLKPINFVLIYVIGVELSNIASGGNILFYYILNIVWIYIFVFSFGKYFGFDIEYVNIAEVPEISEKTKQPIKFSRKVTGAFLAICGLGLLMATSYVSGIPYLQLGFALSGVMLLIVGIREVSPPKEGSKEE